MTEMGSGDEFQGLRESDLKERGIGRNRNSPLLQFWQILCLFFPFNFYPQHVIDAQTMKSQAQLWLAVTSVNLSPDLSLVRIESLKGSLHVQIVCFLLNLIHFNVAST